MVHEVCPSYNIIISYDVSLWVIIADVTFWNWKNITIGLLKSSPPFRAGRRSSSFVPRAELDSSFQHEEEKKINKIESSANDDVQRDIRMRVSIFDSSTDSRSTTA